MSAVLEESYGRTRHDIDLLGILLSAGDVNHAFPVGSKISDGWTKQRRKLIKDLVGNIFRKSTKGRVIECANMQIHVHTPTGTLSIPPGVIDRLYFGTFPRTTSVELIPSGPFGRVSQYFYEVGNPDFV